MGFSLEINDLEEIAEATLRELSSVDAVREFWVVGLRGGGLGVVALCGSGAPHSGRLLGTSRGGMRRFASIDTAAGFLREMGVTSFAVDTGNLEAGRLRPARPDRSAALKRTRTIPRQAALHLQQN